ncbi:MAG: metalloregulator ArsR/SmtB family transcription factor [Saprospiraceae bacterium]|nr:metalloregulator ArsR/SmtB family transcription factor [Saprospiraceae bacterium]
MDTNIIMDMNDTSVFVDEDKLETAASVLRALAHPLRLKIIDFIDQNKVINVNKIYNTLGLEQSITSQHLRILRLANLVSTTREGKQIFYRVHYDNVQNVVNSIKGFLD